MKNGVGDCDTKKYLQNTLNVDENTVDRSLWSASIEVYVYQIFPGPPPVYTERNNPRPKTIRFCMVHLPVEYTR